MPNGTVLNCSVVARRLQEIQMLRIQTCGLVTLPPLSRLDSIVRVCRDHFDDAVKSEERPWHLMTQINEYGCGVRRGVIGGRDDDG